MDGDGHRSSRSWLRGWYWTSWSIPIRARVRLDCQVHKRDTCGMGQHRPPQRDARPESASSPPPPTWWRRRAHSGPAWMTWVPGRPHPAASSTTTSTTRPIFCDLSPDATNDAVLDGQCDLFAGLDSWAGLVRWTDALVDLQVQLDGRGGCPIANLLAQVGERDDRYSVVLASGFDRWEASDPIRSARHGRRGELRSGLRCRLVGRLHPGQPARRPRPHPGQA